MPLFVNIVYTALVAEYCRDTRQGNILTQTHQRSRAYHISKKLDEPDFRS